MYVSRSLARRDVLPRLGHNRVERKTVGAAAKAERFQAGLLLMEELQFFPAKTFDQPQRHHAFETLPGGIG